MSSKTRTCPHDGFHSALARYRPDLGRLRYVVVCDDCRRELREMAAIAYRPDYRRSGRPPSQT